MQGASERVQAAARGVRGQRRLQAARQHGGGGVGGSRGADDSGPLPLMVVYACCIGCSRFTRQQAGRRAPVARCHVAIGSADRIAQICPGCHAEHTGASEGRDLRRRRDRSVFLLHPPLPLVGVSIWMERGCQWVERASRPLRASAARPPAAQGRGPWRRSRRDARTETCSALRPTANSCLSLSHIYAVCAALSNAQQTPARGG